MLFKKSIILLLIAFITFNCFSMDTPENNLFKIVRTNSREYAQNLIESAPQKVQDKSIGIKLRKKGIIADQSSLLFFTGKSLVSQIELAKAIACHHSMGAWIIDCPMLGMDSPNHVFEKIRKIFNLFKSLNKPHILIFEEINELMDKTKKLQRSVLSSHLCSFIDSNRNNPNLIFIATASELTKLPKRLKYRITSSVYPIPFSYEESTIKKLLSKKLKQHNNLTTDELNFWAKEISKKQLPRCQVKWLINSSITRAQIKKFEESYKEKKEDSENHVQTFEEFENAIVSDEDIGINFEHLCERRAHLNIDKPFYIRLWNYLEQMARNPLYKDLILPLLQSIFPIFPVYYSTP